MSFVCLYVIGGCDVAMMYPVLLLSLQTGSASFGAEKWVDLVVDDQFSEKSGRDMYV